MKNINQAARIAAVPVLALAFVVTLFAAPAKSQEFQQVPLTLSAQDVLVGDFLRGHNYRVKDAVTSDGLVNVYELETFYGPLKVESTPLLRKRINELRAIYQIEQMKGTDTYKEAFKKAAVAPLNTAKDLITDPVNTVTGVATGIGNFFNSVERAVTTKDPYQSKGAKGILGQTAYKRQFAAEFGVDPYSTYAPLQKALDDMAWTATAGGLTVKAAMMAIPGAAGTAVGLAGTTQSVKALATEKTPAELEEINRARLSAMGVPETVAHNFLSNNSYDPYEKTLLVGALSGMSGVKDRPLYVARAAAAHEESVTLYMRVRAQLMELYNEKNPVDGIIDVDGIPGLMTKDGKVVGILPLDYIAWTQGLESREAGISGALNAFKGVTGKELWVLGKVSADARKALEARGWKVEEDIQGKFYGRLYY